MKKNDNPKSIAFILGLFSAVLSTAILLFFTRDWVSVVLNFIFIFFLCFFTFHYILNAFIFDKIKTIYRNIYQYKTSQDPPLFDEIAQKSDPLTTVSNDVLEWMKSNQKEMNDLKELESYRKEFLGNVSHELKTPIQSIQGYIHTLLDGALEDKKVNRLFLEKAGNSTQRLIELVDQLTSISILEGKSAPLILSKFDMIKLTEEVFEIVDNKAKKLNIQLGFQEKNAKQVMVEADRSKIRQVMVNLIVNAIKYGKEDGYVSVGFYDMDQTLLIEVSDDGQGISNEHLPRLFERFYRTDKGRSRDQGGTGLGLSIVKHIIEAHQQMINVRSTVGVGSIFGFTLKKGA